MEVSRNKKEKEKRKRVRIGCRNTNGE